MNAIKPKPFDFMNVNKRDQQLANSIKAIERFLVKHNLRRNKDVLELYLASENLSQVANLDQFKNMTILWLNSNNLREINFFQNCYSLSEIYLHNNFIQSIENCFRMLSNLNVLFLHSNQLFDLNQVTNELSYLKFLKNLNLFDNPIALEKNYRNLMITQVSSLEILDRSVVSLDEKIKANKCLNGEQEEVKTSGNNMKSKEIIIAKPVLTQSMESARLSQTKSNLSKKDSENSIDLSSRTSLSDSSQLPIRSTTFRNSKMSNSLFQSSNENGYNLRRSIKEFSYFDWPKTLSKEKNVHENKELPQVITIKFK